MTMAGRQRSLYPSPVSATKTSRTMSIWSLENISSTGVDRRQLIGLPLPVLGTVAARGQKNEGHAARGMRIWKKRICLAPTFKNASSFINYAF